MHASQLGQLKAFVVLLSLCQRCKAFRSLIFDSKAKRAQPTRLVGLLSSLQASQANHLTDQVGIEFGQVSKFTELAIFGSSLKEKIDALKALGKLSARRLPLDFSIVSSPFEGSRIAKIPGLLDESTIRKMNELMKNMQHHGWLSTNPDSVDGLPSFHLNLVSNGRPLFSWTEGSQIDDFERGVLELLDLVKPHIYGTLLSRVREALNSTDVYVSDIFLRRYGEDLIDGESRSGISSHYDVYSKVTSVVALDDVAATGKNGLFTYCSPRSTVSNHAALRRFFSLSQGDAVIHTWDVLHGVDVEPGHNRTSLVVWFTGGTVAEDEPGPQSVAPWLMERHLVDSNSLAQFVLASAIEASLPQYVAQPSLQSSMFLSPEKARESRLHPHDLYLQSASAGNPFALTRLGSLCDDKMLSAERLQHAQRILDFLRPDSALLEALNIRSIETLDLAARFWLEGAFRGHPIAQIALGHHLMERCIDDDQARLLSTTLFGLAAQQGDDRAMSALEQSIEYEMEKSHVVSELQFLQLPVVQIANAACAAAH